MQEKEIELYTSVWLSSKGQIFSLLKINQQNKAKLRFEIAFSFGG
jgi:hypothetical protein